MRLAALFSGGKDSTYAVYQAVKQGYNVKYLITIAPKSDESWMFHHPCIELTKLQAQAMGMQQIFRDSSGAKESELLDLSEEIAKLRGEVDGIVSGAIASEYQRSRIDSICKEFGLSNLAPSWGRDVDELLMEELNEGFEIIVVSVSSQGLDESWLGRKIDSKALGELKKLEEKFGLNITGEGGEFETFVTDCPLFRKKVVIKDFEKIWDSKTGSGRIVVKDALLEAK